ncbi:MAG: YbaK/EbsC family protein, partial [Bacillota bacterium]|nr:YbaK/EbsC family protein [Bacillota bacterium]
MSVQAVKDYLKKWNLDSGVMEMELSSATVELAAEAVGVIPARIAKTLSFKDGESCILIVTAGDAKVDNTKFKAFFKMK